MNILTFADEDQVALASANFVKNMINNCDPNKKFVLGLPTGSTPVKMYKNLINMYRKKEVSFKNVITFNMDEYYQINQNHPQSYHTFMYETLFNHIDILPENINILNSEAKDPEQECNEYEKKIQALGPIDLFIGGVGCDGHLAFNEPGSSYLSSTRQVYLTYSTREANKKFFNNNINEVPKTALSIGIKTFLDAKNIMIIATGPTKADSVKQLVEGAISHNCPITYIQLHASSYLFTDRPACDKLMLKTYDYHNEVQEKFKSNLLIL